MTSSDICRLCGADHQMPESVLQIRQSGFAKLLRRSFILRLTIVVIGIGILFGIVNLLRP
jgi:hypothetical protein